LLKESKRGQRLRRQGAHGLPLLGATGGAGDASQRGAEAEAPLLRINRAPTGGAAVQDGLIARHLQDTDLEGAEESVPRRSTVQSMEAI
jgi:hypothetical protein